MLRRLYLLIIIALYALSVTGAFAQETRIPAKDPRVLPPDAEIPVEDMEPCGCNNLAEIEQTIRVKDTKIAMEKQLFDGHGPELNYPDFEITLGRRLSAFNTGLKPTSLTDVSGWTDPSTCETGWKRYGGIPGISKEAIQKYGDQLTLTHCMHVAIDQHEAVHRKKCLERKGGLSDWLDLPAPGWELVQEDIEGDTATRDYMVKQKTRLLCSCNYYSVRLEMEQSLGRPGALARLFAAQSTSLPDGSRSLTETEKPYVDVSMRPNPRGELKGDGEGITKGNFGTPGITADRKGLLDFHISAAGSVPGPVHATIQMVSRNSEVHVAANGGTQTIQVDAQIVGREATATSTMGRRTQVLHTSVVADASAEVDFPSLDAPIVCSVPAAPMLTCHATLAVAEEYRDAQATYFGSTVREALIAIATKNGTVIAACPLTK